MIRRHFLPHILRFWRPLTLTFVSLLAATGLALLKPWPLRFLFDDVLVDPTKGPGARDFVLLVGVALVLLAAGEGLLSYVKEVFLTTATERISFAMRVTVFSHMQRLPLSFYDGQRTGDLLTRITRDVDKALELLSDDIVGSFSGLLTLVGIIAIIFAIDWQLALVMLVVTPILLFLLTHFRGRIRAEARDLRHQEGQMASLTQETLAAIKVVKAYGNEGYVDRKFEANAQSAMDAAVRVARLDARFGWFLQLAMALGTAAVVVLGAYHVLSGVITVGILVVFVAYVKDFYSPLRTFSRLSMKYAQAKVRLERVAEILDLLPEVTETDKSRPAPPFKGLLEFEKVSFSYVPGRPVLIDVSLTARPGEVVALVGPTGSGKSTLASLVPRLYDPSEGRIKIDGEDTRSFTLQSLRGQIALVLQETVLFRASVWENIAYGRPEAKRDELEAASRDAGAHGFIMELSDGYDTVLSERGGTISGGQRQLIAIARALVRNAPLLILDEPTTNLDAMAEAEVIAGLKRLMAGRTTILITHRLGLVERANLIAVLDEGRLLETGTHAQLLKRGGLYAQLYAAQTGGH